MTDTTVALPNNVHRLTQHISTVEYWHIHYVAQPWDKQLDGQTGGV